jgi:hypothetical protein
MSTTAELPKFDPDVRTVAEFLNDSYLKGHDDADLRKYLIHTRGLSVQQVDEAFKIHKNRTNKRTITDSLPRSVIKMGRAKIECETSNDKERPEKVTTEYKKRGDDALSFLVPNKRSEGRELIKDLLNTEWNYCVVLWCLQNEYHSELVQQADQKKFSMTREEVDEIFRRTPELLRFHKAFYADVKKGGNIGRMFVRLLDFFKGYADYMKECTSTIRKMRDHTTDKRLWRSLKQIKLKSSRRQDDMVNLLLVPLDRIVDYKDFLNTLYGWADKAHKTDYELLGKASRRIGRIAKYVNEYKQGIFNRNEMNKVQCFLGKQYDILSPTRRIVRRGMIMRRTTGWMSRNKHWIFFLFNDVLLWTTRKGELLNVVQLRNCSLYASDCKSCPAKKFKVIVNMERNNRKILDLECKCKRQRDEWYSALEIGIQAAKESIAKAWSQGETTGLEVEKISDDEEESLNNAINISDNELESKLPKEINDACKEPDPLLDESYDDRYENSFNFAHQEFKEIDTMDETVSQISEFDQEFYLKHTKYREVRDDTTMFMSPFRSGSNRSLTDHAGIFSSKNDLSSCGTIDDHNSSTDTVQRSSIIRRPKKTDSSESFKLEKKPSVKISLRDGNISCETDHNLERPNKFAIHLNDFDK